MNNNPGWQVVECNGEMHVKPIDDLQAHTSTSVCWCRPNINDDLIWVHHSMDRREFSEPQTRITQ